MGSKAAGGVRLTGQCQVLRPIVAFFCPHRENRSPIGRTSVPSSARSRQARLHAGSPISVDARPVMTAWTVRVALALCGLVLLAGCGGSSHTTTTTSTSTATTPPMTSASAIDSCLVGKWRATTGTLNYQASDGTTVTMTGGQGEVLTITADGRYTDDYSNFQPATGSDGANQYSVTETGTATGHLSASGGTTSATLDDPTAVTITVSENGTPAVTTHAHAGTGHYTCTKGTTLTITATDGSTTTYVPGG